MKRSASDIIAGSAALKPECSRYRNENERIISFVQAQSDYRCSRQQNGCVYDSMEGSHGAAALFRSWLADTRTVRDLKAGNVWGRKFECEDSYKMGGFAVIYTIAALFVIGLSAL